MKAVNGYLENGRFKPLDMITLPRRAHAVLVYNDMSADSGRDMRLSRLKRLHGAANGSAVEEMCDFPTVCFRQD